MGLSMDEEQSAVASSRCPERAPAHVSVKVLAPGIVLLLLQFLLVLAIYLPAIRGGGADFRTIYTVGYMVRTGHGHDIYDENIQKNFQNALVSKTYQPIPYFRFAYQALFFVPFSLLSYIQAYFLFLAFNLGLLFLCMMLLRPYMLNLERINFCLPALLFLFFPVTVALMQGQDSILLLALLTGSFLCLQRERDTAAGALVALGLIKFQIVIPIFLLFLAWRRWRFSAAFACTSAVLAGISAWIIGFPQMVGYLHTLIGIGSTLGFTLSAPAKMNMMANLHGALYAILKGSSLVLPLTVAASAAVMILVALRRPRGSDALLIAIPVGALVSYYMYIHDLCILILPIIVILDRLIGTGKDNYRYRNLQLWAAVLLLIAPTALIFAPTLYWTAAFPLLAFTFAIALRQPAVTAY
jgi:hypothetical protein